MNKIISISILAKIFYDDVFSCKEKMFKKRDQMQLHGKKAYRKVCLCSCMSAFARALCMYIGIYAYTYIHVHLISHAILCNRMCVHVHIKMKTNKEGRGKEAKERERKCEKSNYTTFALPLAPFCGQFLLRTRITVSR